MNDLPALDVVKEIDPSLLELKSEKKTKEKLSTAVIFMKIIFIVLISLMFLVFLKLVSIESRYNIVQCTCNINIEARWRYRCCCDCL